MKIPTNQTPPKAPKNKVFMHSSFSHGSYGLHLGLVKQSCKLESSNDQVMMSLGYAYF